ncbi:LexA family protein [Flavobacterium lindanitolerans]|jgi:DNA polymerase V|uniref:DNA polymerase V n=1 Tax=Flavobacterium lindanitolerans TaxID=428988 RepID=A0A497UYE3_9FLAO|nr:translesion error-prone DNA polymerase V autoproteolytic subunit [Flavobacterium lindanitolerans]PKW28693.1 DNA polymerase V [Flavobacterium lindanitolerans]RLJ35802.1 DNA polymerase V [Flavobacterium lindanitolerans]
MPLDRKHKAQKLTFFKPDLQSELKIPYVSQGVSAGFPSPALDFLETTIDLNKALIEDPETTFYIKAEGHSMIDAGINDKDILVVDRSLEPADKKIAICFIDGEFTVKRLKLEKDGLYLMPENQAYKPIKISEENNFMIWGIVTYVIKKI